MKKVTSIIFILVITITGCCSQDIVLKKSGEEILAKVLEIGSTEIMYVDYGNHEGPTLILLKSDIFMIRYKNGTKDIFTDEGAETQASYSDDELSTRGKQDAIMNYKGKNSGVGWTAATTVLLTPLVGVIPAAACSYTQPASQNLNHTDNLLLEHSTYNQAYIQQAHKMKKKKIWKSFGISSGAWLIIILLL